MHGDGKLAILLASMTAAALATPPDVLSQLLAGAAIFVIALASVAMVGGKRKAEG